MGGNEGYLSSRVTEGTYRNLKKGRKSCRMETFPFGKKRSLGVWKESLLEMLPKKQE